MSYEQTFESMSLDERARLRKQMADQAVKLAISGRWEDAAALNRDYLRLFGDDADAYNRLGKATSEVGRIAESRAAYSKAVEVDPTNTIARRNLDRLATMEDGAGGVSAPSQVDTRLFVEETGKSTTTKLQAVDHELLPHLDPGDVVELQVQGKAVNVLKSTGEYIGMVEPRTGLRLAKLIGGGNQYAAALVSTADELKVTISETFQHPSQIGKVSFPHSRATAAVRGYTRKGLLRGTDLDIDYSEDDEVEEEESDDGWTETSDEMESPVAVSIDSDEESFD